MLSALPFVLTSTLSDVPYGAPGSLAPDTPWDLQHLHLELDVDVAGERIQGAVELTGQSRVPRLEQLRLDQVDLDIHAVTIDGRPTPFTVDARALWIDLPHTDDAVTVRVEYSAVPRTGLHFRNPGPDSPDTFPHAWSQGEGEDNRYWIPLPDYPNDRFSYSGAFTVPPGHKALSNGVGTETDGTWRYTMQGDLVSYLVMLAVGPFQIVEVPGATGVVEQWIGPDVAPSWSLNAGQRLPEMMDLFAERTGQPYAYGPYREVYVERFLYGGMENTSATVMSADRMLVPDALVDTRSWPENVVAHELAHQWFGDLITCRTWHELWLNEGFATFYAAEWERVSDGDVAYAHGVARRYDASLKSGPLAGRSWSTADHSHAESANVYSKGASVLQMLRVMLGEEVFWEGMRAYVAANAHGLVETDDLRHAMEDASGMHLRWFFDQWTHLPGAPTLRANHHWSDGQLTVEVSQQGFRDGPEFALPVDVEIGLQDGVQSAKVWLTGGSARVVLPVETRPLYVAIDPKGGLLVDREVRQQPREWVAQATLSPSPYAQVRAVQELQEHVDNAEVRAALTEMASAHPEQTLRVLAIRSLATAPDAQNTLLVLGSDPDPVIRKAAVKALKGRTEAEVATGLRGLWSREDQADVRAELLSALGPHDRAFALKQARSVLRTPSSVHNPMHAAALDVYGAHGDPGDLKLVVSFIGGQEPSWVTRTAMTSAVRLVAQLPPGPERLDAQEQVARAIEPLLGSADLRTRQSALGSLPQVGDARSAALLRTYASLETVPWLAESATQGAQTIASRDDSVPVPNDAELQARLERMEQELDGLREDMDAVLERP